MLNKQFKQKLLYDLFQSYYEARKNKRNTLNQLDFEFNLEKNIINLYNELITNTYDVWKSIYFIQNYPVKREIFAWDFRDRIVHHLIYNYISPIFEKEFIYDSYSCRKWKWTSFWIKRINKFIRSATSSYTKDAYILKLDIEWYFMSLNKDILYKKIEGILKTNKIILEKNNNLKLDFILNLIYKLIYNDCTKNSIFKWKREDYIWLAKNKSLFFAKENFWLPIWNLTSQLFSNIYLSDFDKYIKQELKIKYYGRYVDDFILIHNNKEYLKLLIIEIKNYLKINLQLNLHPKKIYLQHYYKWVMFLWVMIKPYRMYIRKRTIWNLYNKIQILNKRLEETLKQNNREMTIELKNDFLATINSYLWFMRHYKNYNKRKHILENIVDRKFWKWFKWNREYNKVEKYNNYKNIG